MSKLVLAVFNPAIVTGLRSPPLPIGNVLDTAMDELTLIRTAPLTCDASEPAAGELEAFTKNMELDAGTFTMPDVKVIGVEVPNRFKSPPATVTPAGLLITN
jgi:hypothetical protein